VPRVTSKLKGNFPVLRSFWFVFLGFSGSLEIDKEALLRMQLIPVKDKMKWDKN